LVNPSLGQTGPQGIAGGSNYNALSVKSCFLPPTSMTGVMAHPLGIEFPGAVCHITSRGDRREAIFVDDMDREGLLGVAWHALGRFGAQTLSYCEMSNHYHFVIYEAKGKT
jgi:hypothetical protein